MDGARSLAVFGKAVAAQTVNAHTPTVRAGRAVEHAAHVGGVNCNETVDLIIFH